MKKILTSVMIALMAIALFSTCKKDDDTVVKPSVMSAKNVINSNSDIVSVKALTYDDNTDEEVILATTPYQNDGFKLTLKTPPENCLYEIGYAFEFEDERIVVSDPNAKIGFAGATAYNHKDKEMGEFYFIGISTRCYVDAIYIYADRNFTVKGKIDYGESVSYYEEYNCSFKKGWNILYVIEGNFEGHLLFTTKNTSGVTLEWVFDENYYWDDAYIRFVKNGPYANCQVMGASNNYYGGTYYEFGSESGTSPYLSIPEGNCYTMHWDEYYNYFTDITDYNLEADAYYSVVCSENGGELHFNITKDNEPTKSIKHKSAIPIHKPTIAKRRALRMNEQ